jgi:hypothetical protein
LPRAYISHGYRSLPWLWPSNEAAGLDGTPAAGYHHVFAEAVLVTNDFGPEVKPIAVSANPTAGLSGKSVGDRRAGHNGTEHVPAMKGMMAHRTNPMYENSPARSGKTAFMNGVVFVRSD